MMASCRLASPGTAVICLRHAAFSAESGSESEEREEVEARGESTRLGGDFARLGFEVEGFDFVGEEGFDGEDGFVGECLEGLREAQGDV